jgi:hypothetical protein
VCVRACLCQMLSADNVLPLVALSERHECEELMQAAVDYTADSLRFAQVCHQGPSILPKRPKP